MLLALALTRWLTSCKIRDMDNDDVEIRIRKTTEENYQPDEEYVARCYRQDEVFGDFKGLGATPIAAVENLFQELNNTIRNVMPLVEKLATQLGF